MGGIFLTCGLVLGVSPQLVTQVSVLLIGWATFLWFKPRLSLIFLMLLSLVPLGISPSRWHDLGLSLNVYYDLLQSSPLYSLPRMMIDPWTLPWSYDDSPFHFLSESSKPLVAPFLFVMMGSIVMASSFVSVARAND